MTWPGQLEPTGAVGGPGDPAVHAACLGVEPLGDGAGHRPAGRRMGPGDEQLGVGVVAPGRGHDQRRRSAGEAVGLHQPPNIFTYDIPLNRASERRLAELDPAVACFGHGPPLRDTRKLVEFVSRLPV